MKKLRNVDVIFKVFGLKFKVFGWKFGLEG